MKTIFITIFQGVEAKNILRTDIYKKLIAEPDLRLIFFVGTPERAAYYQKEFNHPRIVYESISHKALGGWDRFFSQLSFLLLRTDTVDLRRRMAFEDGKSRFWYYTNLFLSRLLAWRLVRKLVRFLDYRFVNSVIFEPYFDKYQPAAVFLAHLFDDFEIHLLREARRRGVPTIGFVNSWDKMTARGMIRLLPDKLLVFNDLIKEEAIRYADMDPAKVIPVGIPPYDWHIQHQPLSKAEFFNKNGLDLKKKLIVYAPMGKAFSNSDWDIIDLLNDLITNAQLFVRFQPNDFTDEVELKKRPWLKYDLPGIRFSSKRGIDWDMSFDDIHGLTDTLANCDVFICYASSMSIDAAVFDKPVINIDFEIRKKELMSKSPTYFYKMTHYKNAVKAGGIAYPKSRAELIAQVNKYLENLSLDREGRRRLVAEQCWKMDGRAGERIANFLIGTVNSKFKNQNEK